ncbi:type II toxin-antitoxin system death-on-curing family toxin [Maridesulfovibrio salexigens]|uniref:Death-on-curing family protein n=1 Tax=Maridesulfovibrio salexigens (strain ATCC 14822 / DSM 2638 / NCIMB 8403 / VKM B-1763) TaxID=526222 RepID=C6BU85_MARSD|nr:type II toxin-antitoxin system death-on-curing family toxin [Maridesulfovibrio salexigens]ACS81794.1 death-on-curing family protein [Maridesulfovibrio salexigens DSM 2638]
MKVFYIDLAHAVEVHDYIISESGGTHGVLNSGSLESVLELIKNDSYYPDFLDKIAHLCFAINKNHAFNDGNKRTSIALGAFFLSLNGYDYCVSSFIREMENYAVWIAENKIHKELLRNVIEDITMGEFREETHIAVMNALSK